MEQSQARIDHDHLMATNVAYRVLFGPMAHSFETHLNTDPIRCIASYQMRQVRPFIGPAREFSSYAEDASVSVYELKNPTPDDRVSICFAGSDSLLLPDNFYLCIPRAAWLKIEANVKKYNISPLPQY